MLKRASTTEPLTLQEIRDRGKAIPKCEKLERSRVIWTNRVDDGWADPHWYVDRAPYCDDWMWK